MTHYKNSFRNVLMALLGGAMLCAACKKDEPKSAACEIVSFTVNGEAWNINGTDIIHAYPAETEETSLTPAITLSPGATVNPPANAAQNFFTDEGVTYTVTAEDGVAKKTYTAKATRASYTACDIVSFSVNGVAWEIDGTDITHAYSAEMAATSLAPTITLSPGATVNPPASAAQNFFTEEGVTYAVTAEDGVTKKTYTAKATVQAVDFGMTGECIWALTGAPGNYTLTISGNGAMANYGESPWYQYREDIKTAVIQDGVTTIGDDAFDRCIGLTTVTIGNSVTAIGVNAFYGCRNLTSVIIPNSVTAIGGNAFYDCDGLTSVTISSSITLIEGWTFASCSSLTSITIPNSVTTIYEYAFYDCSSLTTVSIPNSVTTIDSGAFSGCRNLTAIHVDAANTQYSSENGVLFNKDKTTLMCYPAGKTGNSYVIPNSVTTISSDAFSGCSGLISVTIPNSVTSIGNYAFAGCSGLTAIHVDAANTQYNSENGVLFNKDKTTLMCYPAGKTGNSYVIPNSVTTISADAFSYCHGLTTVTIPNSVTTISNAAFAGCHGLSSVTIGNSVQTIGEWAFAGCYGVTTVTNLRPAPQSINSNVFNNVTISTLTLKVSVNAVETYKAAPIWGEFGNIIANE